MIAATNIEALRPGFEAYIRSERGSAYLERHIPPAELIDGTRCAYINDFVQEAWEAWVAAKDSNGNTASNPAAYDCETDTFTIHGVQYSGELFKTLGFGPIGSTFEIMERKDKILTLRRLSTRNLSTTSHVHCQDCDEEGCPGVRVREALPDTGPSPEQILRARVEGRAEALEILTNQDAETFATNDNYMASHAIADTGDYGTHWKVEALRELFKIDDMSYSEIDSLAAAYWGQQALICDLQTQIRLELSWLPIEQAETEKDGRYILGWFPDRPRGMKANENDPPESWVAAVRWSGQYSRWGMVGVGGLSPAKFLRIAGPDGKPVGYIRTPEAPPA